VVQKPLLTKANAVTNSAPALPPRDVPHLRRRNRPHWQSAGQLKTSGNDNLVGRSTTATKSGANSMTPKTGDVFIVTWDRRQSAPGGCGVARRPGCAACLGRWLSRSLAISRKPIRSQNAARPVAELQSFANVQAIGSQNITN